MPVRKSIVLPDDLVKRIKEWAKSNSEPSLIYGVRWSTAIRELIERGLKDDRRT